MKRALCMFLTVLYMLTALPAVALTRFSTKNSEIEWNDDQVQITENGEIVFEIDEYGECSFGYALTSMYEHVRFCFTGTAYDGNPFVISVSSETSDIPVTHTPGMHGPYELKVSTGQKIYEYQAYFKAPSTIYPRYNYGSPLLDYGGEYYECSRRYHAPITIESPEPGEHYLGAKGCELHFYSYVFGLAADKGDFKVAIRDPETGKIIAEKKSDRALGYDDDSVAGSLEINKDFESGKMYEVVASCGDAEAVTWITLWNVHEPMPNESDEPIRVLMEGKEWPEDTTVTVPLSGEYANFLVISVENAMYAQVQISGKTVDGEKFEYVDYGSRVAIQVADQPGVYGPYDVTVSANGQKKHYIINIKCNLEEGATLAHMATDGNYHGSPSLTFIPDFTRRVISLPLSNTVYYGDIGYTIPVLFTVYDEVMPQTITLVDPDTGNCIGAVPEEHQITNCFFNPLTITAPFEDGKKYDVVFTFPDEVRTCQVILMHEPDISTLPVTEAGMVEYTMYAPEEIVPLIEGFRSSMKTVSAGQTYDFLRLGYLPEETGNGLLKSFSLYNPSVQQRVVNVDIQYLLDAANRAIYEQYQCQFLQRIRSYDALPINLQMMDELFGKQWTYAKGMECAQGLTRTEDGTAYYWIPVYYTDDENAILNNDIYLFVMIVRAGEDVAYLQEQIHYRVMEQEEGISNVEMLLIADPAVASEILTQAFEQTKPVPYPDTPIHYADMYEYERNPIMGYHVLKLQRKLEELGYLTTSPDGVFGASTTVALQKYQKAEKLPVGEHADSITLHHLYSDNTELERLEAWLAEH